MANIGKFTSPSTWLACHTILLATKPTLDGGWNGIKPPKLPLIIILCQHASPIIIQPKRVIWAAITSANTAHAPPRRSMSGSNIHRWCSTQKTPSILETLSSQTTYGLQLCEWMDQEHHTSWTLPIIVRLFFVCYSLCNTDDAFSFGSWPSHWPSFFLKKQPIHSKNN